MILHKDWSIIFMKYLNYLYNYLSPRKKMDQKESSHKGKAKKEEDNFEIKSC